MRILALDVSTNVGWALFAAPMPGSELLLGTYRVPSSESADDYGFRTIALESWLEDRIKEHEPDVIAFESPFIPMTPNWNVVLGMLSRVLAPGVMGAVRAAVAKVQGKNGFVTTQHTLRLQISLANTIETTAARRGIRVLEVASMSAKKELTGSGRAQKETMIIAAKDRGWPIKNQHEADACGVGLVAIKWVSGGQAT